MIRYFLACGDRGGSAVITEGLPSVICSNPQPKVQIATLYMKTWCEACKREGFIAPRGPRLPGTGPNGQPWALSGDINVCGCTPPPVFHAVRGMKMMLTAEEATTPAGGSAFRADASKPAVAGNRVGGLGAVVGLVRNDTATPLGDASPFGYRPERPDDAEVVQLAGAEGMPRNNQAQNRQTRDVVRALGLNRDEAQQLHREVSGEGLGYHEIMERAKDMFNLW